MELQDKRLTCVGCGREFVFTVGEQTFFREKGLTNEPKRCKQCKARQVSELRSPSSEPPKIQTSAICSRCGQRATVPFKPTQNRPVLCRECFETRRPSAMA